MNGRTLPAPSLLTNPHQTSSLERRDQCPPPPKLPPSTPPVPMLRLSCWVCLLFFVFVFFLKYKTKIHLAYHHRYIYFTLTT